MTYSKEPLLELRAGLTTWLVVTGFALYIMFEQPREFIGTLEPALLLFAVNVAAMIGASRKHWSLRRRRIAHAIQLISAFAVGGLLSLAFLQIYTIIWIAMATGFYPLRWCYAFVAAIAAIWYWLLIGSSFESNALLSVGLFATFHWFALLTSDAARRAEAAREHTESLYRELVATQHLLTEASRQSERTRIARNLHDLLGHHLTALSINLQIAERLTSGDAQQKVAASRGLAKLLLSDVRESVSTLRDQSELDLRKALQLLVDNVPQLSIELTIDSSLSVEDVQIADALLRCVQEAITNSLKHANAQQQWIRIWQQDGQVHLQVHDDGRVQGAVTEGNGLAGMRERLRAVGGQLSVERIADALKLSASIPLPGH
ncbi:MAG: histidine kinase [Pseudomonadota bacterium]